MTRASLPSDVQVDGELEESSVAAYCASGWRQQVIVLAVAAAAVLGFALKMGSDPARREGAGLQARLGERATAAARSVALSVTQGAAVPDPFEGSVASARPVAATTRASFNDAVARIRPSTLAVRASYGADANGQLLERVGSAVAVDAAGYAVTCSHVVSGASAISVRRFRDPERWSAARAVASDGDLTLLLVADNDPLAPAVLADSSRVGVGDWVLAVGHPFQLGLTVTAGIVSQRNAELMFPGGRRLAGLLQTDAAINEGSSGGPLINVAGEVVGINSAIYSPTGGFSGAGFAITSNRVRDFVAANLGTAMRASAPAPTSWGLGLIDLTPGIAATLSFPGTQGVVVNSVAPNSAADQARLTRGDVITAIAGRPVVDLTCATNIRSRLAGGGAVPIEVWRSGVVQTVTLRLPTG